MEFLLSLCAYVLVCVFIGRFIHYGMSEDMISNFSPEQMDLASIKMNKQIAKIHSDVSPVDKRLNDGLGLLVVSRQMLMELVELRGQMVTILSSDGYDLCGRLIVLHQYIANGNYILLYLVKVEMGELVKMPPPEGRVYPDDLQCVYLTSADAGIVLETGESLYDFIERKDNF